MPVLPRNEGRLPSFHGASSRGRGSARPRESISFLRSGSARVTVPGVDHLTGRLIFFVPLLGAAVSGRSATRGRSRFTSRWFLALVLLVLAVVFVVENRAMTEIRLLIPVMLMPLWAALVITLVVGLIRGDDRRTPKAMGARGSR